MPIYRNIKLLRAAPIFGSWRKQNSMGGGGRNIAISHGHIVV